MIKTFQKCLPKSKEQVIDKLYNSKIREIEGKKSANSFYSGSIIHLYPFFSSSYLSKGPLSRLIVQAFKFYNWIHRLQ